LDPQYGLDDLAGVGRGHRFVHLIEREVLDEIGEWNRPWSCNLSSAGTKRPLGSPRPACR
jgi:hypothetical protein